MSKFLTTGIIFSQLLSVCQRYVMHDGMPVRQNESRARVVVESGVTLMTSTLDVTANAVW